MVIDNCPAHPQIEDLRAIHLEFLPPNTTSHTQPCNQGIINAFKHNYRAKIVRKYLQYIDSESPSEFHISVLDARYDMRCAWGMITHETIANCFKHAGFYTEDIATSLPAQETDASDELSILISCI